MEIITETSVDNAEKKRVELHTHTNMSVPDGTVSVGDLIKRAAEWGHSAIAITDYCVVQTFPDAMNAQESINRLRGDAEKFKVIYGLEANVADDTSNKELPSIHRHSILAKNAAGLKNLYKLVSNSHLAAFDKAPSILLSELEKHRDGLVLGSRCGVLSGAPTACDYIEIQPIDSEEAVKEAVRYGEKMDIPVVATGNACYLDAEDARCGEVLITAYAHKDMNGQQPLYLKTTAEMQNEFKYLGEEKAYEVVVTNSNKIADMIEYIRPIPKGSFLPELDGAQDELTELIRSRMEEIYGETPPAIVKERAEKELNAVVANNFAALYMTAGRLVERSEQNGYPVGSRGCTGASLIAYLIGFTKVNPLPPHYVCDKCKYSKFFLDGEYGSGFDLPEKNCPVCGEGLSRDGHEISVETFLGWGGDKKPDIDLNFSAEYQAQAQQHIEELFGSSHIFKVGAISTITERTALALVEKYEEENSITLNKAEKVSLIKGITGVKQATSQHPGGIIIVPKNKSVYDFTPVQYFKNKKGSEAIITHFDFRSLCDTLYKFDMLCHDTPTIYRYLEDYSEIPAEKVPLCDKEVMSLFTSPEALGISPDDTGIQLGTLALPGVGTVFMRKILTETQPNCFSDLVQIYGLSHGAGVWFGNARDLIRAGVCKLSEALAVRDSIMTYLIRKGIEPHIAYEIMEIVRKGSASEKLTDEHISAMTTHGVPDWYIESCMKIKYMFPKAHAVAYMTDTLRLGWYKIYKPLAFYAAYFTVYHGSFGSVTAISDHNAVRERISELRSEGEKLQNKEREEFETLVIINEMMARGIGFLPVDADKSDNEKFLIEDGNIRLPLSVLPSAEECQADDKRKRDFFAPETLSDIIKTPDEVHIL